MKPGEQKPHWAAPWSIQASCSGCGLAGVPMPSTVVMFAPSSTRFILVAQARTTLPSMMTEHAPHWPSPQPTLVPVRPRLLRSTLTRVSSASTTRFLAMPLTTICFLIIPVPPNNMLFQTDSAIGPRACRSRRPGSGRWGSFRTGLRGRTQRYPSSPTAPRSGDGARSDRKCLPCST
ncbi:hypothetical protein DSECCO2_456890 [anaerobic digester metagenome]